MKKKWLIFCLINNYCHKSQSKTLSYELKFKTNDVTESSNNDCAVAAMAHELCELVDTANAPIFGIGADGKVDEWN
eukprot:5212283-Ditylum_brightwellii.AAC.1